MARELSIGTPHIHSVADFVGQEALLPLSRTHDVNNMWLPLRKELLELTTTRTWTISIDAYPSTIRLRE
jgi:hypothetical protein